MVIQMHRDLWEIRQGYCGFICDAFGVFWNGSAIYPGVLQLFEKLQEEGRKVIILSNASASSQAEETRYGKHGLVKGLHYQGLITSGDLTKAYIHSHEACFAKPGNRYWVFCGTHPIFGAPHRNIFEGSGLEETEDLSRADFIYIGVPHKNGDDQTDGEHFREEVAKLIPSRLPMLCANPDQLAQHGSPPRFVVRQGAIAALYEEMGGEVISIGKPSSRAFTAAIQSMKELGIKKEELLMVGDNSDTDILGANRAGIDSALVVETGMLAHACAGMTLDQCAASISEEQRPTHWICTLASPE